MISAALYSLRTDGDQWRITKFVDGDVESSYLCSTDACECPAGHRHTCRHRQMLPSMIAHGLANSHWFFAYDASGQIVDFNGTPKRLLDELAAATGAEGQRSEAAQQVKEQSAFDYHEHLAKGNVLTWRRL